MVRSRSLLMEIVRPMVAPRTERMLLRIASRVPELPVLLVGSSGIGKGTVARWLAANWGCQDTKRPCGECEHCREVIRGGGSSFSLLDAAGGGSIAELAQFHDSARLVALDRFQVAVLEHVDHATPTAVQGLLKLLEDGPKRTLFILTSDSEEGLPSTLRSRCLILYLSLVPDEVLAAAIAARGIRGENAAHLLAEAAGRPGRLFRALDEPDWVSEASAHDRTMRALCDLPLAESLASSSDEEFDLPRVVSVLEQLLRDIYRTNTNHSPRSVASAIRELLFDVEAGRFTTRLTIERMVTNLQSHA